MHVWYRCGCDISPGLFFLSEPEPGSSLHFSEGSNYVTCPASLSAPYSFLIRSSASHCAVCVSLAHMFMFPHMQTHAGWIWSAPCSLLCGWCFSVFELSPWELPPALTYEASGIESPLAYTAPTRTNTTSENTVTFVLTAKHVKAL